MSVARKHLRIVKAEPEPLPVSGPSDSFIRLTRDPEIAPPSRVVRTLKGADDVEISTRGVWWK